MHEEEPESWDFFVSYAQADDEWATWIAWELEEAGYRALIMAWDSVAGRNWAERIDAGVLGATRTIAVLSASYLESVYGAAEWRTAWAADPAGARRKLLPVRVEDCDRPGLLGTVAGFDLFGLDEQAACTRLLVEVGAAISGRRTPSAPSRFPGADKPRFPGRHRAWNVPRPQDPHFTGRDRDLAELEQGFARAQPVPSGVTVQVIRGLEGVGKATLAAEYAHRHNAEYGVVWWAEAEKPELLPDEFDGLVRRLGHEPVGPAADPQAQVRDLLAGEESWLLIFHNANANADIAPWLPTEPRAADAPGHVIVSTKHTGFPPSQMRNLEILQPPDAVALLTSRADDLDPRTAAEIAKELGWLPLALAQAGGYLMSTGEQGEVYLRQLRRDPVPLFQRGTDGLTTRTIATLWDISLERIAACPAAVQLLEVCAYLAPEPIPENLFTGHPGMPLPESLSAVLRDPVIFTDTVAVLVEYSLAERSAARLRIHRLVQAVVRARCAPGAQPLRAAVHLLRVHSPAAVISDPRTWERWKALLPHVLAATDFVARETAADSALLADAAWLLDRAGTYQQMHARLDDAQTLMERALYWAEDAYGPDDVLVGQILNNLAAVILSQGRADEALPLAQRAVDVTANALGLWDPYVATCLSTAAAIHCGLGQLAEAGSLIRHALSIYEDAYRTGTAPRQRPGHDEITATVTTLAAILRDRGELLEAQRLFRRVLAVDENAYGGDHLKIAIRLTNLATVLRDPHQLKEAHSLLDRARAINKAVYGSGHLIVADSLDNLVPVLKALGRDEEARLLAEEAEQIRRRTASSPDEQDGGG
jgi:tetratricopeptide (TPR) repeat protein